MIPYPGLLFERTLWLDVILPAKAISTVDLTPIIVVWPEVDGRKERPKQLVFSNQTCRLFL